MNVAEQVMEALVDLSDDQQTIVLDFVEFLRQRKRSSIVSGEKSSQEAMRSTLRQVAGCAKDGPADLSTNPTYLEGFG